MADLQIQLQQIIDKAVSDAQDLVSRIVRTSVEEALTGKTRGPAKKSSAAKSNGGGRIRRSPQELEAAMNKIGVEVKKHKEGVSAEVLAKSVKMPRENLARALSDALGAKIIKKKGQRRATRYFPA